MPEAPENVIRHYVIATSNLARTSGELHDWLGVEQGHSSTVTVGLGFANEMMMLGKTMLEVVQPLRSDHALVQALEDHGGDFGRMIVLQSAGFEALRERAVDKKLTLIKDSAFNGQRVLQFDPEVFGTRFETYEYNLPDGWWGAPLTRDYKPSTVVREVAGAEVAVADPDHVAAEIAEVFQAQRDAGASSVRFGDKTVQFVADEGGRRGLLALDLIPIDPVRRGESKVISGTEFRFV